MKRNLGLLLVLGSLSFSGVGWAQGTLVPAGAPAPTMRSLDQIYGEITKLTPSDPLVLASQISPTQQGAIHLSARGAKQGVIKGGCTIPGLEQSIVCIGFGHEVVSPRDPATGLPTGKRQHKPVLVTKYMDQTTPLFFSALVSNENLTDVTLKFYQTDAKSQPTNQFQIKLTNANLSRITNSYPNLETLEFYYQKIEWTYVPTGVTAMDDWSTP